MQNPRLRKARSGDGSERAAAGALERPRKPTERASAGSLRPPPKGCGIRSDNIETKEGKLMRNGCHLFRKTMDRRNHSAHVPVQDETPVNTTAYGRGGY